MVKGSMDILEEWILFNDQKGIVFQQGVGSPL